jgi:hypothetical protein
MCPVADIAQQTRPNFLGRLRLAGGMAGDNGVGPHCRRDGEIFEAVGAQTEALGFKEGNFESHD